MHLSTIISAFALAGTTLASINTTREYELRTQLKPGQDSKERFDNLWLVASHTGAGLNDAVLYANRSYAIKGFENATNITQSDGQPFFNQLFDLGGNFPYDLYVADVNFYAAWEPVRINGGSGTGGFFMNSSGLQWDSDPSGPAASNAFGGWLVCDWWHGVPQLFAKWSYYHYENPSSCADVDLLPVYI
ncbi:hypothetical protein KCU98_g9301, partial [Aureobasidium melanogenum]